MWSVISGFIRTLKQGYQVTLRFLIIKTYSRENTQCWNQRDEQPFF